MTKPEKALHEAPYTSPDDEHPVCSTCGDHITGDTKYFVYVPTPRGWLVEVGCAHYRPRLEGATVLGSIRCMVEWLGAQTGCYSIQ